MSSNKIGIIGYGVVGKNIGNIFCDADIEDPQAEFHFEHSFHDVVFIAVPTPSQEDGRCDVSIVVQVLKYHKAGLYIIKSTVPPGFTKTTVKETNKEIVFSPEYQGETQHCLKDEDFVIIGGEASARAKAIAIWKGVKNANVRFYQTDSTTAELVKYMENSFLATKVTFCTMFWEIAKRLGVEYNELRELFCADPRVNRSHTFVYEDHPFYESKCFDKDLPALWRIMMDMGMGGSLVEAVIKDNNLRKLRYAGR